MLCIRQGPHQNDGITTGTEAFLRAENAELRRLLEKHQWAGLTPFKSTGCCPECSGASPPHSRSSAFLSGGHQRDAVVLESLVTRDDRQPLRQSLGNQHSIASIVGMTAKLADRDAMSKIDRQCHEPPPVHLLLHAVRRGRRA